MPYTVRLKQQARRDLKKIPKSDLRAIARRIDALAQNPRPEGAKKLTDTNNLYRIRVGDYRIIYQIHAREVLVLVIRIRRRDEFTYRGLR